MDLELLKKLTELNGVSGDEDEVRDFIISQISGYADSITVDNLGSIIAFKKGRRTPPEKILYEAHMDETGYYVKKIEDDGFIRVDSIGVPLNVTPGKTVKIKSSVGDKTSYVPGVFGSLPVHLSSDRDKVPDMKGMYIDIGAKDKGSAEGKVRIGDRVCFDSEFGTFGRFIKGKAFDDRAGCYVLIKLIRTDLEYDSYFAFSVQEEVGCRGAKAVGHHVNPDIAFILEGTTAADIGAVEDSGKVCLVGEGVALSFMDRASIYDPDFIGKMKTYASEANVKYQLKTFVSGGNDGGNIQRSCDGTKICTLSVPVRYLHSRISVCSPEDIQSAYDFCIACSTRLF